MDKDLEQQLQDLQKHFSGLAKTMGSSSKAILKNSKDRATFGRTQKALNITMDDYWKGVKKGDGIFNDFSGAVDAAKKDVKELSFNLKAIPSPLGLLGKGLKILYDATIGVGVAMVKTVLALSDATKQFHGLEDIVNVGIGEISYVGKAMSRLTREIDTNVGSFRTLAQTGASFGSSIVALRKAQEDTKMPLTKFMTLIQDNTGTLAKLFGTVDRGIPQIVPFMDKLRDVTMNEFGKFGLTLDETSTFLGTYLELERARGNTARMTQDQLLAGTRAYTKDLVILSKLTGKSVDELNEQNMAMAADGVFQSQLTKMSAERAKTLSLGIGELPGPLKQLAKEVLALGGPISDTSRDLSAMSNGAFTRAIKQFRQDGDIVAFQNAIKTTSRDVMQNAEAYGQATLAGGRFGEALNAIAASIGESVNKADITGELEAAGDNIAEILNITTGEFDKMKESLETAVFHGLKPLAFEGPKAADGVKALRKQLDKFSGEGMDKMNDFLESFGQWIIGGEDAITEPGKNKKYNSSRLQNNMYKGRDYRGYGSYNLKDELKKYDRGSHGFKNFGSGTLAELHGVEAVVPKNDISQLTKELMAMGTPVSNAAQVQAATNNVTNNTTVDVATLNANTEQLVALSKKVANHLNMLVTIGAMTEKNTKNVNNKLANIGGSLV